MERKRTDIQYHVHDNNYVAHQDVRMYCNKNRFPELPVRSPHSKPNVKRVLSKQHDFSLIQN